MNKWTNTHSCNNHLPTYISTPTKRKEKRISNWAYKLGEINSDEKLIFYVQVILLNCFLCWAIIQSEPHKYKWRFSDDIPWKGIIFRSLFHLIAFFVQWVFKHFDGTTISRFDNPLVRHPLKYKSSYIFPCIQTLLYCEKSWILEH